MSSSADGSGEESADGSEDDGASAAKQDEKTKESDGDGESSSGEDENKQESDGEASSGEDEKKRESDGEASSGDEKATGGDASSSAEEEEEEEESDGKEGGTASSTEEEEESSGVRQEVRQRRGHTATGGGGGKSEKSESGKKEEEALEWPDIDVSQPLLVPGAVLKQWESVARSQGGREGGWILAAMLPALVPTVAVLAATVLGLLWTHLGLLLTAGALFYTLKAYSELQPDMAKNEALVLLLPLLALDRTGGFFTNALLFLTFALYPTTARAGLLLRSAALFYVSHGGEGLLAFLLLALYAEAAHFALNAVTIRKPASPHPQPMPFRPLSAIVASSI